MHHILVFYFCTNSAKYTASFPPFLRGEYVSLMKVYAMSKKYLRFFLPILLLPSFKLLIAFEHPYDPLSTEEATLAVRSLTKNQLLGADKHLQLLTLDEPHKDDFLKGERHGKAIIISSSDKKQYSIRLNLKNGQIVDKRIINEGMPALTSKDFDLVEKLVKKDSRWLAGIQRRTMDPGDVFIEAWAPGDLTGLKLNENHRYVRATSYFTKDSMNSYSRPIEGLYALIDITEQKVIQVLDNFVRPISKSRGDFITPVINGKEPQAEWTDRSNSISMANGKICWQNFCTRLKVDPREGLVLYDVNYDQRSILDRISLSEMVVPYGSPDPSWHWRCAFDEGEYGVGNNSVSLQVNRHFPEGAKTFDAFFAETDGSIKTVANAVAVYERPAGVYWSHYDMKQKKTAAIPAREMVVSYFFTVSNYDYGLQYVFSQDGSIEVEVILTGILQVQGSDAKECQRCETLKNQNEKYIAGDRYGTVVDKNLLAVIHQHFFNFRIDFSIEGHQNSVAQVELAQEAQNRNPYGNAFFVRESLLTSEFLAKKETSADKGRVFWFFNEAKRNSLGHFSGYVLEPKASGRTLSMAPGYLLKKAPFLKHDLWITPYRKGEMHAAGEFPNQQRFGHGLESWTKGNANLRNQDLVAWYTVGVNHIPRAEEWPIMPKHRAGFALRPMGFLTQSPATEVIH